MTASYASAGATHTGVVVETVTGGGYTYVNVDEQGNRFWVAAPQTTVDNGAQVSFAEQIWMVNFKSKALNRSFDKILFVSGIEVGSSAPGASVASAANAAPEAAEVCTIEDIFNKKRRLKGHLVKVRGEVVKVSENIMGRTWVHIQDGTGSEGTNKVIFRSVNDTASVGDTVTAQGKLETDKDFGFGYFYSVIVEDATFTK